MEGRSIEERTEFIGAVKFDFEERAEIENVVEWIVDNPEEAAAYIVWIEKQMGGTDGSA